MCKFVLMQLQHVGISHKVHKKGGWVSQQDNGTCSNFGYRRCPHIKIRLMSDILEDTLTETKKIIPSLDQPLNLGKLNGDKEKNPKV